LIRVVERPAAGESAGALVFLHGYWGVPEDFEAFLDKVDPARRLHGLLPQAPIHVSEGRYTWEGGEAETESWFDALPWPRARIALGGWSQGASLAYRLGLRGGEAVAGLFPLGGWVPQELEPVPPFPPVLAAHGRRDEAIPVDAARAGIERLRAAGVDVRYRETDIDHRIDQAVVPELRAFLEEVL
jgi:phospholipase/carboxylesterase